MIGAMRRLTRTAPLSRARAKAGVPDTLPTYASRAIREPERNHGNNGDRSDVIAGGAAMTDRSAELEIAVRAQDALIAEAQRLLTDYLRPGGLSGDALIDELRKLFQGPRQREAQRLSREALGEDFGNNA